MSKMYNDLMAGINEAINDAKSSKKILKRNTIKIEPLVDYKSTDKKRLKNKMDMLSVRNAMFQLI